MNSTMARASRVPGSRSNVGSGGASHSGRGRSTGKLGRAPLTGGPAYVRIMFVANHF